MSSHASTSGNARSRQQRTRVLAIAGALVFLLGMVGSSSASHLPSDTSGHTTLDQTICAQDPAGGACLATASRSTSTYYNTLRLGPGEPFTTQELDAGRPVANSSRDQKRRSLLYFSQLTDFQLADEESPARVEFLDPTSDQDPSQFAAAAWRPQEALQAQMDDRAIHQINALAAQSPVAQGDGSRAKMALALTTGDSIDSQEKNETKWVVRLLEGGTLNPNSGSSNLAHYDEFCQTQVTAERLDPNEASHYTGVQDYNDYAEGTNPDFYDPNNPRGAFANWPSYPGLMDRAQATFQAEGLKVPSYVVLGNHDGLVQGNQAANQSFEKVATGCQKEVAPSQQASDFQSALQNMTPENLAALAATDPDKVALVPPDPNRQFVSTAQYKALHGPPFASDPDAHGFKFVDPAELSASNGAAAYYSWSPVPGGSPTKCDSAGHGAFCFIGLNTVGEGGVTNDHSSDGNLDDPQFRWLESQLRTATDNNELVVLFGHHAIDSLNNPELDEDAPACTTTDSHPSNPPDYPAHDTNPGCDVDPRNSADPSTGHVHLGQPSQRQSGDTTKTLSELLFEYPNAIAFVAGHSHVNRILRFAKPGGDRGEGFWNIKTAAEADWPSQSRLIEVMDNRDGTLSIFGTVIDHSAPTEVPAPGTSATGFSVKNLASLNRIFAYNDPQKGGGTGEGSGAETDAQCGNAIDDDGDGKVNDGCPASPNSAGPESGAQCDNAIDDDGDGKVNDGCPARDPAADRNVELLVRNPLTCEGQPATLTGTAGDDTLVGTPGNDVIVGLDGNDAISGGAGDDKICGGDGNDTLTGGRGADDLQGDADDDTVSYLTRTTGVTVTVDGSADDGNSVDQSGGRSDNVASDVETVIGGSGADTLTGSDGANTLRGKVGDDLISGLGGDDFLIGNAGADTLTGGAGADTFGGRDGNDSLFANEGTADTAIDCDGGPTPGTADVAHVDPLDPDTTGCETTGP